MRWRKQGLIFRQPGDVPWGRSHAQIPTPVLIDDQVLRIFYGTRDSMNRTHTGFVDVRSDEPSQVLNVGREPVLEPGKLGTFDDSGAMPSCVVRRGSESLLYYIGWNVGTTVRYRNAIGLARWDDASSRFERVFEGPVMDRTACEPFFVVTPYVLVEDGRWRMWYCGCTEWQLRDGVTEPRYQIKYAESADGVSWVRNNVTCIPYQSSDEANTRPCVVRSADGTYRMWYCHRKVAGYRTDRGASYRIGYAKSADGIAWERQDDRVGIEPSDSGWDSEMLAYPFVYEHRSTTYLIYNGNGFGASGFGYAVLEAAR